VNHVAKSMGMDGRIGGKFLHPGPGFGGSCFPKDIKAIVNTAKQYGVDFKIVDTVIKVNQNQKQKMVEKIMNKLNSIKNPTATILGLSFKPETDDLRESPAIYIIEQLLKRDVNIKTYDPVAMNNCSKQYPKFKIDYCLNEYEACANSDILIFATEWNQFRSLNLNKVKGLMRHSIFMDLRNIYEPNYVKDLGFDYEGVGRK
jgi:UDPglucose 6-dehydrogenase